MLLMRGDGRSALSIRVSPLQVLLGFAGLGLCPAFCLGLMAGQLGLSSPALASPHMLRTSSLLQGFYAAQLRTSYEIFGRSRPKPSPAQEQQPATPTPPAVEELLSQMEFQTPESRRGILRVHSLHFDENIAVRPFDAQGRPQVDAFAAISHIWRCRITNHEAPINDRLVRLLTTLNDLYDRPVHLISGHRVPHTLGTSDTSQHVAGTAADIRVPGVSIKELRAVVTELGARGVGLYNHKGFVHVDFRKKHRYFWVYPEAPEDREGDADGDEGRLASSVSAQSGSRAM